MSQALSIQHALADRISTSLLSAAPREDGCFCLLHEVRRGSGSRLVLGRPLDIPPGWDEQNDDRLTPSSEMISSAVTAAEDAGSGLAFIHSHPASTSSRPHLSAIDRRTSKRLGVVFDELLDGPFASLVIGARGWGGAVYDGALEPLERILIVGRRLQLSTSSKARRERRLDQRQELALGERSQAALRQLRVGIVGAGGTGSPLAETLARMGVGEIVLVDHDALDTPSNARRVFGVRREDAEAQPPLPKATAVATGLSRLGLGSTVTAVVGDVRRPEIQASLLGVDAIVTGTDTHSSRAAAAELALRGCLPLIDVGVRVGTRAGDLDALRLERRIQLPDGPCLFCWGVLDPERIRIENLPEAERNQLLREGYIAGEFGGPTPSVAALTVTAAGVAASALLGLLAGGLDVAPLASSLDALTLESFPLAADELRPDCICQHWRTGA